MEEIINELDGLQLGGSRHPASFVIQGGYFETARGPDALANASLQKALELGAILRGRNASNRVKHDLLINDLGISCSAEVCDIASRGRDPDDTTKAVLRAREAAEAMGVELTTTTERYMRNWGFRRMKKILKEKDWQLNLPRLFSVDVDDLHQWKLKSLFGADILLFEEKGTSWIAKCPIIMGAYYAYLLGTSNASRDSSLPSVVIDLCGANDRDKVCKGAETAFTLFNPAKRRQDLVMPVLCDALCHTMLPATIFSMDVT